MNTPLILFFIILIVNSLYLRCKWKCKYIPCYIVGKIISWYIQIGWHNEWEQFEGNVYLILSLCMLCLRVAVAWFVNHTDPRNMVLPNTILDLICTPYICCKNIVCTHAVGIISFNSLDKWVLDFKFFLWSKNYVCWREQILFIYLFLTNWWQSGVITGLWLLVSELVTIPLALVFIYTRPLTSLNLNLTELELSFFSP